MRIQTIRTHNYMNQRATVIEIPPAARTMLIAGPNGSGKTSLLEAVRAVLTGEIPRGFKYKKEMGQLITTGEKDGSVGITVMDDDGHAIESRISLKTGACTTQPLVVAPRSLAVAPQQFMLMEATQRRRALFALYGVSMKQADIVAALEKEGHAPARVTKIATSLGAGFDAAGKRAKELVSEARGAWQALTGETYGSNKADGWAPAVPEGLPTAEDVAAMKEQLTALRTKAINLSATRKAMEADEGAYANVLAAERDAGRLPGLEAELQSFDERVSDARAKQSELLAQASSAGGWTSKCPHCQTPLRSERPGKLEVFDEKAISGPRASAEAEALSVTITDLTTQRAKKAREVDSARANKLLLERLPPRPDAQELAGAKEAARIAADEVALLEQEVSTAEASLATAVNAERNAQRAADFHADVAAFAKLGEAIEAIPAKYLTATLERVNTDLADVSRAFNHQVQLGEDMELTYSGRPHRLLSESQQWRADLALGLVLAAQCGGVVLMDRFDMVQPADRGAILRMLATQTVAQVIVAATLKADPGFKADSGIYSYWLGE